MSAEDGDTPTVWFAVLERAIRTHDQALAKRAEQQLKRHGVTVTIDPSAAIVLREEVAR